MPEQLKQLLEALGINTTRWQWRIRRYRQSLSRQKTAISNRMRLVWYPHRFCSCGAAAAAADRSCAQCGKRLAPMFWVRLGRAVKALLPEQTINYTTLYTMFCVALYFAMLMQSGGPKVLMSSIDPRVLVRFGAWVVPLVAQGEVWRLVTAMFVHVNLLHIVFNLLWLMQLGPLLQSLYGRSAYVVLLFVSGIGGFAVSVGYRWQWAQLGIWAPGAGASGVVFGLIGASLITAYVRKMGQAELLQGGLAKWAVYALLFSFLPGIDMAAHLGGAVSGGAIALILPIGKSKARRFWFAAEVVCILVFLGSFALLAASGR